MRVVYVSRSRPMSFARNGSLRMTAYESWYANKYLLTDGVETLVGMARLKPLLRPSS